MTKSEEYRAALQWVAEILASISAGVEELKGFGLNYRLTDARQKSTPARRTRSAPTGPCVICGFTTDPVHDGRNHPRGEEKKPFTKAELATKGYSKAA